MQEISVMTYWIHIAAIYFRITFTKKNFFVPFLTGCIIFYQLASLLCIDLSVTFSLVV